PRLDIAEDELTSELSDSSVISEAIAYRMPFVVIVDHDRICKSVLHASIQNFRWKRKQLVQRDTTSPSIFEVALALHPAVILAVSNDVNFFDVVHANIRGEHRSVGIPGEPVGVAEPVGIDFAQRLRVAVRGELVRHRNGVISKPLLPMCYGRTTRINAQNGRDDRIEPLSLGRITRIRAATIAEPIIASAGVEQ